MSWDPPIGQLLAESPPDAPAKITDNRPKGTRSTPEQRLAALVDAVGQPSTLVAYVAHVVDRHALGLKPGDDAERRLFAALDKAGKGGQQALRDSVRALRASPVDTRRRLVDEKLLVRSLKQPIPAQVLAEGLWRDGLSAALHRSGRQLPGGPTWRPWGFRVSDQEGRFATAVAPVPVICAVGGFRTSTHRPRLETYLPEELEQRCTYVFDQETRQVQSACDYVHGDCPAGSDDGVCLHVPQFRPGESVPLRGVNFGDARTKVRLRSRDRAGLEYVRSVSVTPDARTPLRDERGELIADCRVRDELTFRVPRTSPDGFGEFRPGLYTIDVEVPNDTGAALLGHVPDVLSTAQVRGSATIQVLPPSQLTYRIWSDRLICRLESGDPGADEVEIYATLANFPADQDQAPDVRIVHTPRGAPFDGISQGATYSYLWNVLGEGERGVAVPEVLAIALIGYERDSADALRDAVRQWFDAFQLFFRELWSVVKDRISDIVRALASLGTTGLIVAAIALAIVLVIAIIWAVWAPPDLLLYDVLTLSSSELYFLTQPQAPLPERSRDFHRVDDELVSVFVTPRDKLQYRYTEWRRYRAQLEGTDYSLRFHYQRER